MHSILRVALWMGRVAGVALGFVCMVALLMILVLWATSRAGPISYRWYPGPDQCLYVTSESGRLRMGQIKGFPHGFGKDPEYVGWLTALTYISETPVTPSMPAAPGESLTVYVWGAIVTCAFASEEIDVEAVSISNWILFGGLFIPASCFSVWTFRLARRSRHRHKNRCMECGYDLRGTRDPRCPECGTAFEPAK